MKQHGFTVIEILALFVLIFVIGIVFWNQKVNLETASHDDHRKTAINAMYYSLEEVYYPAKKSYPKALTPSTLPSVDAALFKDPQGNLLGTSKSDYRYEPKNCDGDTCKSYTLRSKLQNEADFVKKSRNN
jgi:type II secretory pathway pseudopilin PulG